MKRVIWGCVVFSTSLLSQEVHDLRVVNGVTVDLGPVHAWLAKPEGERPLAHWKQIRVLEVQNQVVSWTRCAVENERGQRVELLVDNLPVEIRNCLNAFTNQLRAIVLLRAQIAADRQRSQALWDRYVYTPGNTFGVAASSRGGTIVENDSSRFSDARAMDAKVEMEKGQLEALEYKYMSELARAKSKLTAVGMFSGRKYNGLEVWDCGRKKQ